MLTLLLFYVIIKIAVINIFLHKSLCQFLMISSARFLEGDNLKQGAWTFLKLLIYLGKLKSPCFIQQDE